MPATKTQKKQKASLEYKRENGYFKVEDREIKNIHDFCAAYSIFLGEAKTEREFHDEAVKLLRENGFENFDSYKKENAKLNPGDRIYYSSYGKTLIAFIIGKKPLAEGFNILGAHIDSPRIDIKQNPIYENSEMVYLDTHYYGGIKKYQWLTIPLAIHGVVVKKNGLKVAIKIGEDSNDPVFCLTDLLPHLAQDQMKKSLADGVEGENLDILVGSQPLKDNQNKEKVKAHILNILSDKYKISEEDFLSAELEIVPAAKPRDLGLDRSMILGYGHDDRVCAYTCLKAAIDLKDIPQYSSCIILTDKEEIGSYGATGMGSNFFENVCAETINLCSSSYNELYLKRALANSWMLSADVNSLFDPLFPSVSEKKNTAFINHGVCVTKYTGSKGKSASSDANAEFMAQIRRIFDSNKIVWQTGELGKVDQGGGGTIAHYMARYGMQVIDCGVGLLSMHAPMEVAGKLDIYMAYKAYLAFLKDARK